MTLKKNDDITLEITALTSQGSGLGRFNDMAVFVDGAAPGDKITAHIIKVKKNYAVGKLQKILKPSKDRIEPDCEAYARCGGCSYRHISYEKELEIKKQTVTDNMQRIGGIDICCEEILSIENPVHYRNKAQIPVALTLDGRIISGFYSKKSHRVAECDDCLLQYEDFRTVVEAVKKYVAENPVTVYDEQTGRGLLRHIYLRQGRRTRQLMVCLVINGNTLPRKERLIERLTATGLNITSVVLNKNKKATNVVLGDECETIFGSDCIEDELCGLTFSISPLSFFQVNPEGTELLYKRAAEYADVKGKVVLDLYCGAGTIGLTMAKNARQVIGVEVISQAIENAKENAKRNNIENVRFICDDASGAAKTLYDEGIRPGVVIVDPPRKGCSRDVLETIARMKPDRVVYVSCDSATLARDCAIMHELGYEVKKLSAVDMFPRTVHCESVVLLGRKNIQEYITVKLDENDFREMNIKKSPTYNKIKEYISDNFGLNVSTLYIAQIKKKYGIEERENYNIGNNKYKVPICPPEKEKAIEKAFKYFGMI